MTGPVSHYRHRSSLTILSVSVRCATSTRASSSRSESRATASTSTTNYAATRNEVGVFTTPPYSESMKSLWRFKDRQAAEQSSQAIFERFEGYRCVVIYDAQYWMGELTCFCDLDWWISDQGDFIGMDIARKFIQMGRTRSLRYALRPSGRKYDPRTGKQMERTGKVYDQGKFDGARVFEGVLKRVWEDAVYSRAFARWKAGVDDAGDVESDGGAAESSQRSQDHAEKRGKKAPPTTRSKPEVETPSKGKGTTSGDARADKPSQSKRKAKDESATSEEAETIEQSHSKPVTRSTRSKADNAKRARPSSSPSSSPPPASSTAPGRKRQRKPA